MFHVIGDSESTGLPTFASPPVIEVALSIQFEELVDFRAIHLGMLWETLDKKSFPSTEEQQPVANMIESFGIAAPVEAPQFQFLNIPPLPRYLFISEAGNWVVQMQVDRFTVNWRKRSDSDVYPRYGAVQGQFATYFARLQTFLEKEKLGSIRVTQAEITYVNRIEETNSTATLEKVVSVFSGEYSDEFLHDPEEVDLSLKFPMHHQGHVIGRLYIDLRPSSHFGPSQPIKMVLLARGKPLGDDIKATLEFFNIARRYIVSAFASITSKRMHLIWQRRQDA